MPQSELQTGDQAASIPAKLQPFEYEDLKSDPRWALVERIAKCPSFQRSRRLRDFLCYVASRRLLDKDAEITEQQIGVHVFGRPATYSPGEDNIVRTTARMLRQKLELFFYNEGQHELYRITIPKGSYIPVFEIVEDCVEDAAEEPSAPDSKAVGETPHKKTATIFPLAVVAVAALVAGTAAFVLLRPPDPAQLVSSFWAELLPRNGACLVVPGDSGLVMAENLLQSAVHVDSYATGAYRTEAAPVPEANEVLKRFGQRRYTSIADLEITAMLAELAVRRSSSLEIKYARDVDISDMKAGNMILIGDPEGNPWVELFAPSLNFQFHMDESHLAHVIDNVHPQGGEPARYLASSGDPEHRAYALIAFTHNLSGTGRALLLEGTTIAGLDAAKDFLSSRTGFQALLPSLAGSRGQVRGFEILLETRNIAASGLKVNVVATRVHND